MSSVPNKAVVNEEPVSEIYNGFYNGAKKHMYSILATVQMWFVPAATVTADSDIQ